MFDDYQNLNSEVLQLQEKISSIEDDITYLKEDLDDCKSRIEEFKDNLNNKDYPLVRESIDMMVSDLKKSMKAEQDNLDKQLEIAVKQYEEALQSITVSVKGQELLTEVFKIIEEVSPLIDKLDYTVLVDNIEEDCKSVLMRAKQLKKSLKEFTELPVEQCFDLADKLSCREILCGINNPMGQLGISTAYIGLATLITVKVPVIIMGCVIVLTGLSVKDRYERMKKEIQLKADLEVLKKSYSRNVEECKKTYDTLFSQAKQDCTKNYEELLADVKKQQEAVIEKYTKMIENKEALINSEGYINESLQKIRDSLEAEQEDYNSLQEDLRHTEEKLVTTQELYNKKLSEKMQMKQEIEDRYENNLEPGTSKLITEKLFLGFDSEDFIVTLDFKGMATAILYTGRDVGELTSLLMMIFVQLLCSTSIASLNFYIFDTNTGASKFAPFKQGDLENVIKIDTQVSDITNSINELHAELQRRNVTILSKAENIKKFNEAMIQKKSLTMDYKIILVQETDGLIYSNKNFEQLCRTGDKVGIIPIVFISYDQITNAITSDKQDEKLKFAKLLSALQNSQFRYITKSKSIERYTNETVQAKIQRLMT